MKLTSKLAVFGGVLAGVGAVALALIKRKQNEEIYHEAEIKAMDELDQMMDQTDECEGCTCAEECAGIEEEQPEAAEEPAPAAEEAAEADAASEEAPAEEAVEEKTEEAAPEA